jgi:hypothetical protein
MMRATPAIARAASTTRAGCSEYAPKSSPTKVFLAGHGGLGGGLENC